MQHRGIDLAAKQVFKARGVKQCKVTGQDVVGGYVAMIAAALSIQAQGCALQQRT